MVKKLLLKIPLIKYLKKNFDKKFKGTALFWEERYAIGGNSRAGSYNRLAEFKAEFLNNFIRDNNISTAMEFGCGDGNQLSLVHYPAYIGLDISETAISICIDKFERDLSKSFFVYDSTAFKDNTGIFKADLTSSLDVIYHIIEDDLFKKYMQHLFNAAYKYVIIYSNNFDSHSATHVREREFSNYIKQNNSEWKLISIIKNKCPFNPQGPDNTLSADFYVYEKKELLHRFNLKPNLCLVT